MLGAIGSAVRLWWVGSAGHRLRPWRSAYLRWRVETFTGKPAATLRLRDFVGLLMAERGQMGSYLRWLGELRQLATERKD